MKKLYIYWKIFISTFYLSAFTFGGGYVIVPMMKKKFADELKWIEEKEILDLIAIAQSSPGAIAVNASIIIGYRVAGLMGSLVAIIGTVLPPLIILSVVSVFYTAYRDNLIISNILKGMQAGIAAVITDVVINMGQKIIKGKNILSVVIMAAVFIAVYFYNINAAYIIIICVFLGAVNYLIRKKVETK